MDSKYTDNFMNDSNREIQHIDAKNLIFMWQISEIVLSENRSNLSMRKSVQTHMRSLISQHHTAVVIADAPEVHLPVNDACHSQWTVGQPFSTSRPLIALTKSKWIQKWCITGLHQSISQLFPWATFFIRTLALSLLLSSQSGVKFLGLTLLWSSKFAGCRSNNG